FAALTLAGALSAGTAFGQEIERLPQDDLSSMRARMDLYESEMKSLCTQLQKQSSLQQAAFDEMADDKKKDDKKKDDPGGLKKEEILTKPTIKVGGRLYFDHMMIDQSGQNLATY